MSENREYSKYGIFNGLEEKQIGHFEEVIKVKTFPSGEVIFEEGDVGDSLYLLLEGKIEINQALTLQLSKGDYDTRE